MSLTHRRTFLTGLGVTLAVPAIIRTPGLLMRVRATNRWRNISRIELRPMEYNWVVREYIGRDILFNDTTQEVAWTAAPGLCPCNTLTWEVTQPSALNMFRVTWDKPRVFTSGVKEFLGLAD